MKLGSLLFSTFGLFACLILTTSTHGQDQPAKGLDSAKLDAVIEKHVKDGDIPGATAWIEHQGQILYRKALGHLDINSKKAIPQDALFRIYSMTKPIVSVAAMMLLEEGKLALDDPVSKYIPAFEKVTVGVEEADPKTEKKTLKTVALKRPMTVKHLLSHTSGLSYGFGNSEIDKRMRQQNLNRFDQSLEEFVNKLAQVPLNFQPGEQFLYGRSTDVLGRVVEVASGQSLDKFIDQRICQPLKMVDAAFYAPESKKDRVASLYSMAQNNKKLQPNQPPQNYFKNPKLFLGGQGMVTSTEDYARFARMLANGGELDGVRILKADTIKLMIHNHTKDAGIKTTNFGLGFGLNANNTFGWGGAAGTRFWFNPEQKSFGVIMIQVLNYRGSFHSDMTAALVPKKS